ncbi:MAG: GHKL domain-containing protein [Bacteroidetes bacterium]|nr:MAG: GHKL domain-containing protein [Bacteroidota bacterium]
MFRLFKTKILLHVLLLVILLGGVGYGFNTEGQTGLAVLSGLAVAVVVFSLFRLVDKTNAEIASFLLNIQYDDYTATYSVQEPDQSFDKLYNAFNIITDKFRDIRQEKEAQFQYLQAIVEHVDTGLICFDNTGNTLLMNRALQRLLHKSYFPDLGSVERFNPGLYGAMENLKPGERQLVKLVVNGQIVQLAVRTTMLKLRNGEYHLYSIQNISAELEEQEVQSWQKLIRILTHEIMNSVTPVASLAATASDMVSRFSTFDADSADDIRTAVMAIQKRSEGLLNFTETYRQLTRIPPPKFQEVEPEALLERVLTLFRPKLTEKRIKVDKQFATNTGSIQADPDLLEQVLINLVKNAIEAVEQTDSPKIALGIAKDTEGTVIIQIADNGPGIPDALQEQIFVPFFTTKNEGSGIGLSLCRQIVQLHKGSLSVVSKEGEGASFVIRL